MVVVYLIKSSNQLINNMAKRGNNFSDFERDIVIEPVGEKKAVIENKRTDAVFPDEKIAALEDITRQYNAVSQTGLRTSKQLHALYDFLKKAERSALSGPEQVIMISMMTGLFSIAFDLKTCSILCKVIPHYLMLFSLKDVCLKYKIQMILQMYLILMQNKPRIIIYKFFH